MDDVTDYFAFVEAIEEIGTPLGDVEILFDERDQQGLKSPTHIIWLDCVEKSYFLNLPWRDTPCDINNPAHAKERREQLASLDRIFFRTVLLLINGHSDDGTEETMLNDFGEADWHRIQIHKRIGLPILIAPDFDLEPEDTHHFRLKYLSACNSGELESIRNVFNINFLPDMGSGNDGNDGGITPFQAGPNDMGPDLKSINGKAPPSSTLSYSQHTTMGSVLGGTDDFTTSSLNMMSSGMSSESDIGDMITEDADTSKLTLFDPNEVTCLNGVRVFDVGQGDCIGLLDQNDDVFCYIDYGGCNDHPDNASSVPNATAKRLPVQRNGQYVAIILTHWDKDHFWSANKKNPDAQDCEWLVPRQNASPQAVLFAGKLWNAKCWPESILDTLVRYTVGHDHTIEIRKCGRHRPHVTKEDRNHTGLAITLSVDDGTERAMILPGDCAYDRIPHFPTAPLKAIVAFHHGANRHWNSRTKKAITLMTSDNEMTYSFGKNSYKHPDRSNYQPDWDKNATTTEEVRLAGGESHDMKW
ncbi:MAG: hypothetical protein ABW090_01075 [Sedimenticola sp.]